MKKLKMPQPKEVWVRSKDLARVQVMGIVDGWVVARLKRAAPFLVHVNEWHKKFKEEVDNEG